MSTFTTRLQLEKPATSDQMNTGDLVLSANYKLIDDNANAPSFTSGTRPGTPYTGRIIFETDTNNERFYNGTKWAYWGNTSSARDRMWNDYDSTGLLNVGATELLHRTVTFNAVQNRRYRIDWCTYGKKTTAVLGRYLMNVRWAAGASVANTDTLIDTVIVRCNSVGTTGRAARAVSEFLYSAASGQITIGLFATDSDAQLTNIAATVSGIDFGTTLVIRDWGV